MHKRYSQVADRPELAERPDERPVDIVRDDLPAEDDGHEDFAGGVLWVPQLRTNERVISAA
jgi:hypothetical protein